MFSWVCQRPRRALHVRIVEKEHPTLSAEVHQACNSPAAGTAGFDTARFGRLRGASESRHQVYRGLITFESPALQLNILNSLNAVQCLDQFIGRAVFRSEERRV